MIIDLIIGITLINALPHMLVGYGNIRFLGLFGYGNLPNIAYAALSTIISITLFSWKYGMEGWMTNGIYVGGILVLLAYWILGKWLIKIFSK
ncbi:MAG: hypothetical protein R2788_11195 [Saprospiraceae bacterium]